MPVSLKNQNVDLGTVPLVSISCTVFNQVNYVEKCIEGMLAQETTFPVEILIHDDASTDGTAELVKRYESEYPGLIFALCQKENQYSKGNLVNEFNFKRARGEFIAFCHGDDYWIDKGKLEKQVAVMKSLGVSISGHPAMNVNVDDQPLGSLSGFKVQAVQKFDAKTLILNNGNMLPFGSIMITAVAMRDMLENMPPVVYHTGVQMLGALRAGIAVMPDAMLAYRKDVPGSTTELMLGDLSKRMITVLNRVKSIKHLKKMYGAAYGAAFDTLLARQAFFFIVHRSPGYARQVLHAAMSSESVVSRARICFMVLALTGVRLMRRLFKK